MSSRQEEKEARRRARIEQEEKERKAAARKRRLGMVMGGVLGLGVIAAVVLFFTVLGGEEHKDAKGDSGSQAQAVVDLPEPEIADEADAAEAAGCTTTQVDNEGRGHEEKDFVASDYESNPPTSGTHFPTWAQDGMYDAGNTPPLGQLVHSLEHGRINVQYKPGTDSAVIDQLESFLAENDGYHMLLYENTTDMPAQITATAWDFKIECPEPNDQLWDALRTFRDAHIDRAPEKVA